MVEVMVVPMLAPITIGIAFVRDKEPEATTATMSVVVVELLCKIAVASNPMKSPTNGFDVTSKMDFAAPSPSTLKPTLIMWIENKNAAIAPPIASALTYILLTP